MLESSAAYGILLRLTDRPPPQWYRRSLMIYSADKETSTELSNIVGQDPRSLWEAPVVARFDKTLHSDSLGVDRIWAAFAIRLNENVLDVPVRTVLLLEVYPSISFSVIDRKSD